MRTQSVAAVLAAGAIVASAVLAGVAAAAAPHAEQQAAELVRQGLKAEVDGNLPERKRALSQAVELAPDYAPARWNQGFVQRDGKWANFAESHIPPGDAAALEEYRRLRGTYADRADAQLELADWCHRRGLKDQERAHLSRSLELNPNQPALRSRLGMVFVEGNWLSQQEAREARERGRQALADLRHWAPRCEKLRSAAARLTGRQREAALEQIRSLRDPAAITALETIVAPANDDAGLAVVEALAEMQRPEADIALARLASFSSSEEVADAAKAKLKKRPLYNFVPSMLGSLVAPGGEQTTIVYSRNGRLLFRQTFMHEGVDRKHLAVFDNAYQFIRFGRLARSEAIRPRGDELLAASELGSAAVAGRSRLMEAQNRQFERTNERICKTLNDVTGRKLSANPREWWKWWNDFTETLVKGKKQLEMVYAGEELPILSMPTLSVPPIHCNCLVAGTPIWTDRGAVAVDKMQVGDRVLAQDPDTGELAYKLVLRTTVREHSGTITIGLPGGGQIIASGGHPFWVARNGWVNARHLKAGMLLHGVDGATEIESVEIDDQANVTVFNLVVEDFHDYFAGEGHLLLHDITPRGPVRGPLPGLEDVPQAQLKGRTAKTARGQDD
ncbi:MAG TPA: polymorphic toxin-type HINT domain-containing protein [Pirellulales bacterium]|nr:polymorphic toxin-type HINT domain-containing protein [Pirellulales bacterium]